MNTWPGIWSWHCMLWGISCPSWQWHRIGSSWSPVWTLLVVPLWCDLGFVAKSCGNKAAANLLPVEASFGTTVCPKQLWAYVGGYSLHQSAAGFWFRLGCQRPLKSCECRQNNFLKLNSRIFLSRWLCETNWIQLYSILSANGICLAVEEQDRMGVILFWQVPVQSVFIFH